MKTSALVLALVAASSDAFTPAHNNRASTLIEMLSGGNAHLKTLDRAPAPFAPAPFASMQPGSTAAAPLVRVAPARNHLMNGNALGVLGGPVNGGTDGSSLLPLQYQQVDAENPYGGNNYINRKAFAPGNGGQTRMPRMREPLLPSVPPMTNGLQIMATGGIEGSTKVWSVYQGPNGGD